MSYVVSIFEHQDERPFPNDIYEAVAQVDVMRSSRPGVNAKFVALAQRLAEGYPGMRKDSGEVPGNKRRSPLPWGGETITGQGDEAVLNLALTTRLLGSVHNQASQMRAHAR